MKKITSFLVMLLLGISLSMKAQSYVPLTLTANSFNADLVANGSNSASGSTSTITGFDGASNVFYSQDFNPGSNPPCGGLPNNGIINSVSDAGVTYQLANYSGNNCLFLVNQNDNGVLTIVNPGSFSSISICASSANAPGASATFNAQLNFSDGSNTIYTFVVADWFSLPNPANWCITALGRYDMSGAGFNGCPNYPSMFDCPITLNATDKSKVLTSITCTKTDASPQRCAIFAVCGVTAVGAPPAVVADAATSLGTTSFTANWETANTATDYKIDVSTSNDFSTLVGSYNNYDAGNNLTLNITGLTAGTTYYYRVRAANGNGQGPNSNIITVANTTVPLAPVATPATSVTISSFIANWNVAATATGYYLDVATDAAFTNIISGYNNQDVGNVTSLAINGLNANSSYHYRIRAYNTAGTSVNSNVIDVQTSAAPVSVDIPCGSAISVTNWWSNLRNLDDANLVDAGGGTGPFDREQVVTGANNGLPNNYGLAFFSPQTSTGDSPTSFGPDYSFSTFFTFMNGCLKYQNCPIPVVRGLGGAFILETAAPSTFYGVYKSCESRVKN